jgi:hypothetical protein
MTSTPHVYEVRPRKDHRDVDLISDALPFGQLWYGKPDAVSNAFGYAKFTARRQRRDLCSGLCGNLGSGAERVSWRSDVHLNSIAAGPSTHNREAKEFKEKDPAT